MDASRQVPLVDNSEPVSGTKDALVEACIAAPDAEWLIRKQRIDSAWVKAKCGSFLCDGELPTEWGYTRADLVLVRIPLDHAKSVKWMRIERERLDFRAWLVDQIGTRHYDVPKALR
jgi:hypothetical protein